MEYVEKSALDLQERRLEYAEMRLRQLQDKCKERELTITTLAEHGKWNRRLRKLELIEKLISHDRQTLETLLGDEPVAVDESDDFDVAAPGEDTGDLDVADAAQISGSADRHVLDMGQGDGTTPDVMPIPDINASTDALDRKHKKEEYGAIGTIVSKENFDSLRKTSRQSWTLTPSPWAVEVGDFVGYSGHTEYSFVGVGIVCKVKGQEAQVHWAVPPFTNMREPLNVLQIDDLVAIRMVGRQRGEMPFSKLDIASKNVAAGTAATPDIVPKEPPLCPGSTPDVALDTRVLVEVLSPWLGNNYFFSREREMMAARNHCNAALIETQILTIRGIAVCHEALRIPERLVESFQFHCRNIPYVCLFVRNQSETAQNLAPREILSYVPLTLEKAITEGFAVPIPAN